MGDGLKFMRITKVYYASTRQQDAQTVYDVIANPDSQLTDISDMIVVETEGIEYKKTPMDFKIVITDDFAATVYEKENTSERNHNIYIEYEAVVTEDAVFGPTDSNPNDTWLTYGDNNVEVAHDQTKTYVFGFDVVKTNGSKKVLNGAKFELYEDKNCITKVPLVKLDKPGENGETVYRVATQDERSAASLRPQLLRQVVSELKAWARPLLTEKHAVIS